MATPVNLEDLLDAFNWVSAAESAALDCAAYVSVVTGSVYWSGEGVDEELPEDIEDESVYVEIPGKSDFDLGRSLALRFVESRLPDEYEAVHRFFSKRGAYARFKALLERRGELDAWHAFERDAVEEALVRWAGEHDLSCIRTPKEGDD